MALSATERKRRQAQQPGSGILLRLFFAAALRHPLSTQRGPGDVELSFVAAD